MNSKSVIESEPSEERWGRTSWIIAIVLIAAGWLIRLHNYWNARALWLDEAMLALNIIRRAPLQLFERLDYEQAAPGGWLLLVKLGTALGTDERALRLQPLLAGMLLLPLILWVGRRMLGRTGALMALALAAFSPCLIYYSNELKQYGTDALMTLILLWAGWAWLSRPRWSATLFFAIGGMLAVWISHPSIFVLAGVGLVMFFEALHQRRTPLILMTVCMGAAWLISFGAQYFLILNKLTGDEFLVSYWGEGFIPMPPTSPYEVRLAADIVLEMLGTSMRDPRGNFEWNGERLEMLLAAMAGVGLIGLWARDRRWLALLLAPLAVAFLASGLGQYPLRQRLVTFLVPIFLLLAAEGIRYLSAASRQRRAVLGVLVLVILLQPVMVAAFLWRNPPGRSEVKPVLTEIVQSPEGDLPIYIYYLGKPALEYYAPRFGLDSRVIVWGEDLRQPYDPELLTRPLSPEQIAAEVERIATHDRIWVMFSNVRSFGDVDERATLLAPLKTKGQIVEQIESIDAYAYLFDFSRAGSEVEEVENHGENSVGDDDQENSADDGTRGSLTDGAGAGAGL